MGPMETTDQQQPAAGPWCAAPNIGRNPHPGEVRGPDGPVAYVSLSVPLHQRDATVRTLSAARELAEAVEEALSEASVLNDRDLNTQDGDPLEGNRTIITDRAVRMMKLALEKVRAKTA